jgi:hypothetical protein
VRRKANESTAQEDETGGEPQTTLQYKVTVPTVAAGVKRGYLLTSMRMWAQPSNKKMTLDVFLMK